MMLRTNRTNLAAMLLLTLVAGCSGFFTDEDPAGGADAGGGGGDDDPRTTPMVVSTLPDDGDVDVARNVGVTVVFSEAMYAPTLDDGTFTLASPTGDVPGTVITTGTTAVFWPAAHLETDTEYTATVTREARSDYGAFLDAEHQWSFTTGDTLAAGNPINLGTAGDYVVLSKAGISTTSGTLITGDLGVSPITASAITGFSLSADASNVFSTSAMVTGRVYAADYAVPTPARLTTAVADMEIAFTDAAARAPDVTELGEGDISGLTLEPGVYKWGTGLLIATDIHLEGDANAVWIFQIAQNLTVSSDVIVHLDGGAEAKNVFWQVSGNADLGTTSEFEGNLICQTELTMRTGASLNGRLLAQTAVVLQSNAITKPAD